MPKFDGTGPLGFGPGAGWGLGPCGAGMASRRGWSRRFYGRGFGFVRITKEEEKEILKNDLANLEEEIRFIKSRLAELEKEK